MIEFWMMIAALVAVGIGMHVAGVIQGLKMDKEKDHREMRVLRAELAHRDFIDHQQKLLKGEIL